MKRLSQTNSSGAVGGFAGPDKFVMALLFASGSSLPLAPLCLWLLFASGSSLPLAPLCLWLLFASGSSLPLAPLQHQRVTGVGLQR